MSVGLALVLGVGSAWAQQPGAAIEQQHRRGIAMLRQGQNEQALAVFREIYERTREPRALWRMATAEAALGRWVEAEGHMSSAFGSTSDAWIRAERAGLEATLRQVQARVGLLTVRCNVPGASIEVDGRAVTSFPLRVVAGDVRVRVRAEGYQEAEATVSVPGNVERAYVREVELRPNSEVRRADSAQSALQVGITEFDHSRQQAALARTVVQGPGAGPWILVGAGGVGLLLSGITYILARDAEAQRDSACDFVAGALSCMPGVQLSTAQSAESRRGAYQTTAIVSLGVGGAAVVAGTLWYLLAPRSMATAPVSFFIDATSTATHLGIRGNL